MITSKLLDFKSKLVVLLIFMQFMFRIRDNSNIYIEKIYHKLDISMEEVTCAMLTSGPHFVAQMNVPYPRSLHS
jgi:hypothetical protein